MADKLHSKAQTFANAWLRERDHGLLPTKQNYLAIRLMIQRTLARNVVTAELQACILQDAAMWDYAIAAGKYIQSVMGAERAAHPFEAALYGAMDKSGDTVRNRNQLARIERELVALQAKSNRTHAPMHPCTHASMSCGS